MTEKSDEDPKALGPLNQNSADGIIDKFSLPSIIAGPAGRAMSNLIGSAVDIPAAYLQGIASDIRTDAEARRSLRLKMSEAAAIIYGADPEIIERYGERWLSGAVIGQRNREQIAKLALAKLSDEEESQFKAEEHTGEDVSDDWLRKFGAESENVSEEVFQELWAKVLAGEIKDPGTIGKDLLSLLPSLSKADVDLIEEVCGYIFKNAIAFEGEGAEFSSFLRLQELGLVNGVGALISMEGVTDKNGIGAIISGGFAVVIKGEAERKWSFSTVVPSSKLNQLRKVLKIGEGTNGADRIAFELQKQDWITDLHFAHALPGKLPNTTSFKIIKTYKQLDQQSPKSSIGSVGYVPDA